MTTQMKDKKRKAAVIRNYKWRGGGFGNASAQDVGEALEQLEVKPGDYHRTEEVMEVARDPDSPLHRCFEWDDSVAAELHRLNQCRQMLRSIACVIVKNEKPEKRPIYIHVTDEDGPRYVNADRVASDERLKKSAVEEALTALGGWRRRFEFIDDLSPIFEAIDEIANKERRKRK